MSNLLVYGVIISLIGVIAAWITIWRSNVNNKLMLFTQLMDKYYQIAKEFHEIMDNQDIKRSTKAFQLISHDTRKFNYIEYMCYLGNQDRYIRKHLIQHMGVELILSYKEMKKGYIEGGKKKFYESHNAKFNAWRDFLNRNLKKSPKTW